MISFVEYLNVRQVFIEIRLEKWDNVVEEICEITSCKNMFLSDILQAIQLVTYDRLQELHQ